MDPMPRASTIIEYREIDPSIEWLEEEDSNTIRLHAPGFRRDQLRVQLTRTRNLIISGERHVEGNIWDRFRKEFPVSSNCDANKITAKYEGDTLFVKQPKLIIPTDQDNNNKDKPTYSTEVRQPPQKNDTENFKNASEKSPDMEKGVDRKSVTEKTGVDGKSAAEKTGDGRKSVTEKTGVERKSVTEKTGVDGKSVAEKTGDGPKSVAEKTGVDGKSVADKTGVDLKSVLESVAEKTGVGRKSVAEKTQKEERRSDEIAEEDGKMTRNKTEKSGSNATKLVDNSGKNRVDNYRQNVGVVATKLKMPRRVMNLGLAILIAVVLGMYVTNSIRSWKKAEK